MLQGLLLLLLMLLLLLLVLVHMLCRYSAVLAACCLDVDVSRLSQGHSTLIGDRGVTLSGGQRQRVSLARAVYSDRDVYLLDDPLAASDPDVALTVFRRVVLQLLVGKTVLIVTHQLQVFNCSSITVVVAVAVVVVVVVVVVVSATRHYQYSNGVFTMGCL